MINYINYMKYEKIDSDKFVRLLTIFRRTEFNKILLLYIDAPTPIQRIQIYSTVKRNMRNDMYLSAS